MVKTIREALRARGAVRADWQGCEGWEAEVAGHAARFVLPVETAAGGPWFWRPEFFGAFAGVDERLIREGFVLGFLDVPDHYGCPAALAKFDALYRMAVDGLGLSGRMAIVALSRGGLSAYRFAARHPERVASIYADNPVCDFRSWPGGMGAGPGSAADWAKLLAVHGLSDEAARKEARQPWNDLERLAAAGIPLLHVCGLADEVVPYAENSALLKERYLALGGSYREIVNPDGLHHPHGLDDPAPIVEFIRLHQGSAPRTP